MKVSLIGKISLNDTNIITCTPNKNSGLRFVNRAWIVQVFKLTGPNLPYGYFSILWRSKQNTGRHKGLYKTASRYCVTWILECKLKILFPRFSISLYADRKITFSGGDVYVLFSYTVFFFDRYLLFQTYPSLV